MVGILPFTPDEERVVLRKGGVPLMFIDANLSDFSVALGKYIGRGVFVWGDRGSGKTHLAVALMRKQLSKISYEVSEGMQPRLMKNTVPVFITVPDLFFEIKQAYGSGAETEADIINKYTEVDYLVMDDFGAEKVSDWSLQILYIIIDRRYRELKKTIVTSNLSLDGLSAKLDDRIASRIAGMCEVVKLKGKDRRLG
jgi:DNA replication protein DnaC